jgi:outer membrane protein assembly factor BamB
VLFENLLILTLDGADLQYLVALDKQTGKTVWKTNRSVAWNDADSTDSLTRQGDRRKAHSTPLLIEFAGKPQLLSAGAKAAYAYDPRTGRELWRVRHEAWSAASRPVYKDGLAFFISGFGGPTELLAVRVDGQGDVTDSHIVWRKADKFVPKTPSPILVEGLLYLVSDAGVVSCLECKTGREVWHESVGGSYAASPIFGDGRLYFCNQQGKTTVMQPGQTSQILATNVLANGMLASPAVSGKALFLRTRTDLVCIESGRPVE